MVGRSKVVEKESCSGCKLKVELTGLAYGLDTD